MNASGISLKNKQKEGPYSKIKTTKDKEYAPRIKSVIKDNVLPNFKSKPIKTFDT